MVDVRMHRRAVIAGAEGAAVGGVGVGMVVVGWTVERR
jgi:hypothetical protein